jgi:hypothetical protein
MDEIDGACSTHSSDEEFIQIKPESTRPLGKHRRRLENYIGMGLRKAEWEVVDWIYMAHDRDQWRAIVNTVMNLLSSFFPWLHSPA